MKRPTPDQFPPKPENEIMEDDKMVVTDQAQQVFMNMLDELNRLRFSCGEDSKEFTKASSSLAYSLCRMMNLHPVHIAKDSELSLFCSTETGFVFGVNYTGSSYNENGAGEWSVNS